MSKIFIGYRHDDGGHAWSVYQHLRLWFDKEDLFIDHEGLGSGEKFKPALVTAVEESTVFLAVIGQHWFSDENGKRLNAPDDITRGEIRTAIEHNKPIILVFCGGATLPPVDKLPDDIVKLLAGHHHPIPDSEHFPALNRLIDQLRDTYGCEPRYRPPHGVTQAFHPGDQKLSPYFSDPLDSLGKLHHLLADKGAAAVVGQATLQGMGGVGKTQLALKYCHQYKGQYAGVWWFKAESLLLLQQDYQQFCSHNRVVVAEGEEPHRAVARFLAKQPRWLLVFDNAEIEYGDKKEHLRTYLPGGDHHSIITARSPELGNGADTIPLDVWTEEQALPFLKQRLPGHNDTDLRLLCQTLGGLPLALEQACAYLLKTGNSITPYCTAITDLLRNEEYLDRRDSQQTDYPLSVMATLSLAFEKLSDAAQQLLRLSAWCAPEPIPELLFRTNSDKLPGPLRTVAADELRWGEIVAELVGFALAQRVTIDLTPAGSKEPVCDRGLLLHRLTQAVVIHRRCTPQIDAPALTGLIRAAFPSDLSTINGWPLARLLSPHVLRLEEHFSTGHLPHRPLSWLLNQVAVYLQMGPAFFDQALTIYRRILAFDKQHLGPDHPDTLTSMNNLAATLCDMGDHAGARKLQEQVLARSKEILGPDHPDILTSMNNLAATLKAMGDYAGARELQEQVLARRKEILGPDHPDTLSGMNNLALTLCDMGDHAGARKLQEQVLARRKEILGAAHPKTTSAAWNFFTILHSMGEHPAAQELIDTHLAWLMAEGIELQSAAQQQIREALRRVVQRQA